MGGADVLYNLAVRMSFTTAGLSTGMNMAMSMFSKMKSQAATAEAAVAKLQARINNLTPGTNAWNRAQAQMFQAQMTNAQAQQKWMQAQRGGLMVAGGATLTGLGVLGLDTLKSGVEQAMNMETALNNVSIATDRASGSMDTLKKTVINTSSAVQFSAVDVANMAKLAATNGLNNRTSLNAVLPMLAKGAEVAMIEGGVNYQQSIPAFVQIAHMFGQYGIDQKTGKPTKQSLAAFNKTIDYAARSLVVSGGTPNELVTALNYLKPVLSVYGGKNFNNLDAIQVSALAENLGLAHGRGGSRLLAFFRGIAPTMGTRGGAFTHHNQNLDFLAHEAGPKMSFWDKKGNFKGFTNMITVIMDAVSNMRKSGMGQGEIMARLTSVFGSAGTIAAATFGTEQASHRWATIQKMIQGGQIEGTDLMQKQIANTNQGQLRILSTNLNNIKMLFTYGLLPAINGVLHALTALTGAIISFTQQHPQIVKFVAIFTALASAAALVAGPILVAVGVAQLLAAAGIEVSIAWLPVTLIVLGVAAAIAAITLVIMNWGKITQFIKGIWDKFTQALRIAGDVITKALHNPIVQVIEKMTPLYWLVKAIILVFQALTPVIKAVADQIGNLVKQVKDVPGLLSQIGSFVPGLNVVTGAGNFAGMVGQNGNNILNWAGVGADNPDNPNFNKTQKKPVHRADIHHTTTHNEHKESNNTKHETHYHVTVNGADHKTSENLANHVVKKIQGHHEQQAKKGRDHSVHHPKLVPNYGRRLS